MGNQTVSALTLTLLPAWPPLSPQDRRRVEADVVRYVEGQIAGMPSFLKVPFLAMCGLFSLTAALRYGRSFAHLNDDRKRAWSGVWALSRIIPMRDFIKLVRSCALLAWYDHPTVSETLNAIHLSERK